MKSIIKKFRLTGFFSEHYSIFFRLKKVIIFFLKGLTFNKGINKQIGNDKKKYKFDYNFIFASYKDWGTNHNEGFSKLLELSEGSKTVFDIGAHIGLCSLPLSRVIHQDGIIYAFEPSSANLRFLKKNIELNKLKNVKVVPNLVGEKSDISIPFYESYNASGMNSLVSYKNNGTYKKEYKDQISIDDFCNKNNLDPDIIKIDVEGAEINVLKGLRNTAAQSKPKIILSAHPRQLKMMGQTVEELLSVIDELGYNIFSISGESVKELVLSEYLLIPSN